MTQKKDDRTDRLEVETTQSGVDILAFFILVGHPGVGGGYTGLHPKNPQYNRTVLDPNFSFLLTRIESDVTSRTSVSAKSISKTIIFVQKHSIILIQTIFRTSGAPHGGPNGMVLTELGALAEDLTWILSHFSCGVDSGELL